MAEPKESRHAWLDLLDVDGPFLSRPALDDVFDAAWPPRISSDHRALIAPSEVRPTEWDEALPLVERMLTYVLGYRAGKTLILQPIDPVPHPIHSKATVTPYAIAHVALAPDQPRMIVLAGPDAAPTPNALDPKAMTDHMGWPSTPVQRAALAARGVGAEIALVTNGHDHLIVWVGSGVTGYAWVDPKLHRLERRLADAFVALMAAPTITATADTSTSDLLKLSQEKQVDVTEKLGLQVRRAAESLVNAVSRANRNTDGRLLAGVEPREVYSGVVTVLMRTVFLLNAEERNLISSGDLWDRAYAVSTLLAQLDDSYYLHQGVMRRRHGAWLRLLAAARAVHGGVHHSQMNVPAYGGDLFSPSRHPFLEGTGVDGQAFDVGVVDDATVRHVLDLLQRLDGQRISYRAFSVEQIGQVYESLLDHSAVRVAEGDVVLGLVGSRGNEPEVSLGELEIQNRKGTLADWLAKEHDPSSGDGKKARWQARVAKKPDERVAATLGQACNGDVGILDRVVPYAGLLRTDARGVALVFLPGDVYVTETADRRDTGTAYTSPAFAAEIAQYALEHLVYEPGPHNEDDESNWRIKKPVDILRLRVCDPAVGSGAILVAAVRYLAEKLVEARLEHGELTAREVATAAADPTSTDPHVQARRDVVAQCIYAVDRDPMAVEMAKLSLWLVTMAHGRPFTFLDHAIKCGDSLLGVTSLDQLRRLNLDTSVDTQIGLDLIGDMADNLGSYFLMIDKRITQSLVLRELVREGDVKDAAEVEQRAKLNAQADRQLDELRLVADAITGVCYREASSSEAVSNAALRDELLPIAGNPEGNRKQLEQLAQPILYDAQNAVKFFHWAVEFPDIIGSGGFDAMVGNPPFQGSKKMRSALGSNYRDFLVRYVAGGDRGTADLVAYFFRRAAILSKGIGLIATNSISQGNTRRVGLRHLVARERGNIYRARPSERWPGRDAVHVAKVWWTKDDWLAARQVDELSVPRIESDLYPAGSLSGEPLSLPRQAKLATQGQIVLGSGFLLEEAEVASLIAQDARNREVLAPYIGGEDVNSSPTHSSARWVINFRDWPEDAARTFQAPFAILEERAKPQRETSNRKAYRDRWWRFAEYLPSLVARLDGLASVIVMTRTSSRVVPVRVPTGPVFANGLVVFPWDDEALLGVLSSSVHRVWVDRYSPTFKTDISYSPSECFENFPMPGILEASQEPALDRLIAGNGVSGESLKRIEIATSDLAAWRSQMMVETGDGIKQLYGRFHRESNRDRITTELRERHVELDQVVCAAYGWDDLILGHGFHDTRYGQFFTVSTEVRFELLMRLLQLNFERAAEQTGQSIDAIVREAQRHA